MNFKTKMLGGVIILLQPKFILIKKSEYSIVILTFLFFCYI